MSTLSTKVTPVFLIKQTMCQKESQLAKLLVTLIIFSKHLWNYVKFMRHVTYDWSQAQACFTNLFRTASSSVKKEVSSNVLSRIEGIGMHVSNRLGLFHSSFNILLKILNIKCPFHQRNTRTDFNYGHFQMERGYSFSFWLLPW